MSDHMCLKIAFHIKSPATNPALEWSISSMYSLVGLEVPAPTKSFSTESTHMVSSLVCCLLDLKYAADIWHIATPCVSLFLLKP